MSVESPVQGTGVYFKIIKNVHGDDVHGLGLVRVGEEKFIISCSKDGSLKQRTLKGELKKTIFKPPAMDNNERWATALCVDACAKNWVAGFRYGLLKFYNQDKPTTEISYEARIIDPPTNLTDQRNQHRIWSLASFKNSIFSGTANSHLRMAAAGWGFCCSERSRYG